MPRSQEYSMTIEEVAKRLNKSIRTIHRYKDSGRLTYQVGATQGNPLYFSPSEVEGLARELYPHLAEASESFDQGLAERLERVERLLANLEKHPVLLRLLQISNHPDGLATLSEIERVLQELAALRAEGQPVDRQELGGILVALGNRLLNS